MKVTIRRINHDMCSKKHISNLQSNFNNKMQKSSEFSLTLGSKSFQIPTFFQSINYVNHDIYTSLHLNGKYQVKSNVDESIFNLFIKYMVHKEIPIITNDNYFQYQKLSEEFDLMKDLVKLCKQNLLKMDKFIYINKRLKKK